MRVLKRGTIPTTYDDGSSEDVPAGAWLQPVRRGYVLTCCDCGLRHVMDFRVRRGRAQFRAWRAVSKRARNDRKMIAALRRLGGEGR